MGQSPSNKKTVIRAFFLLWWLSTLLGPFLVWHYSLQYDADGLENIIWWLTFLVTFPMAMCSEFLISFFPDFPEMPGAIISYIVGSLFIWLVYMITKRILIRKQI